LAADLLRRDVAAIASFGPPAALAANSHCIYSEKTVKNENLTAPQPGVSGRPGQALKEPFSLAALPTFFESYGLGVVVMH
jgi:hypothetical protein